MVKYDPISFKIGLAAALCSKAKVFPKPGREPIGYFYGHVAKGGEVAIEGLTKLTIDGKDYVGAVLPDIHKIYMSELKDKYPHILVYQDMYGDNLEKTGWGCFLFSDQVVHKNNTLLPSGKDIVHGYFSYYPLMYPSSKEWGHFNEFTGLVTIGTEDAILWTNQGILYEDGKPYLSAIDPIPIYE